MVYYPTMAAKKRHADQVKRDRARIAELKFQGQTDGEIALMLADKTGISLSRRQICYDMKRVRQDWMDSQMASYDALIAEELHRLDVTETSIWRAMRDNADVGRRIKRVEKGGRGGTREISSEELAGLHPAYFGHILRIQEERRKLLGLYAPQMIGVKKEVVVKGYVQVSPDEWPTADIIEGEFAQGNK